MKQILSEKLKVGRGVFYGSFFTLLLILIHYITSGNPGSTEVLGFLAIFGAVTLCSVVVELFMEIDE